ncbi:DUF3575 domain-containing protein [Niabella sp. CC-SYL272]|uniref:DUF3575 domain-containing protein n=1 Tax=Niabella agricola TaxID=2891571 RepID=UPI001F2946E4|nr:DUF3575 domain-containing protein [Niabella agricola]MCF3108639.1 DUF3575 domain-containing protein [Niabella agricola]
MNPRLLLFFMFFAAFSSPTAAQQDTAIWIRLNRIRTNLTSIPLKNFSLQYERVLGKRFSAAISGRLMPESSLPLKRLILSAIDENQVTKDLIGKMHVSNWAITPELRFYPGKKGYGQGWYIALFYRHAQYTSNDFIVRYADYGGTDGTVLLSGKLVSNTGGLLLGLQKMLGKSLSLDLWLLGPHIGGGRGDFTGIPDRPLTADEQEELREALEDIQISHVRSSATVDSHFASLKLNGLWGGVRAGVSLGVRF